MDFMTTGSAVGFPGLAQPGSPVPKPPQRSHARVHSLRSVGLGWFRRRRQPDAASDGLGHEPVQPTPALILSEG
jgi:hypothetical protein